LLVDFFDRVYSCYNEVVIVDMLYSFIMFFY